MVLRLFAATLLFLIGLGLIVLAVLESRDGYAIAGAILLAAVYLGDNDAENGKPSSGSIT